MIEILLLLQIEMSFRVTEVVRSGGGIGLDHSGTFFAFRRGNFLLAITDGSCIISISKLNN